MLSHYCDRVVGGLELQGEGSRGNKAVDSLLGGIADLVCHCCERGTGRSELWGHC